SARPARRARRAGRPSSVPPGRHGEATVAEVLVELLTPPLGAPALLGRIVETLALLAAARVEQDVDLLGAHQLLRALEVGEQHGDLLALAGHGGARGQDLLGQMRGQPGHLIRSRYARVRARPGWNGRDPNRWRAFR